MTAGALFSCRPVVMQCNMCLFLFTWSIGQYRIVFHEVDYHNFVVHTIAVL
jgi:hypothetical protein